MTTRGGCLQISQWSPRSQGGGQQLAHRGDPDGVLGEGEADASG